MMTPAPFLSVSGLTKHYTLGGIGRRQTVHALDDVSFSVARGETVGLVGESGSGKTTIGRAILRLIEPTSGSVTLDGTDVTALSARELRRFRKRMQYIFQDPYASLSPRMTVGEILTEGLVLQGVRGRARRREMAEAALRAVDLPADALDRYAFEFSGGQRQRIGIGRALVLEPDLVVADEPVSALDVSVQSQTINLLRSLQRKNNLTMLFISHDLGVVEYVCDRVIVLFLGRVMEIAPSETLLEAPRHPYTRALIAAIPSLDPDAPADNQALRGDIPNPAHPPSGCVFRTRCPHAIARCATVIPPLEEVSPGHLKACIRDDLYR
jgi:peptide/nickel transport system ATP-binding protein